MALNTSHLSTQLMSQQEDTDSIWTLFSHAGIYLMALGLHLYQQEWEYFSVISFGVDLPD